MPDRITLREAFARGLTDPRTVSLSRVMFDDPGVTVPAPTAPQWVEGPGETAIHEPGTVVARRSRKAGAVYVLTPAKHGMLDFRPGRAEQANKLGRDEITAITLAVATVPFPLGDGARVYARALAAVRENRLEEYGAEMPAEAADIPLWKLRAAVAEKASHGMNAPWDTYLRIAVGEEEY
jgi:hypothetical protein